MEVKRNRKLARIQRSGLFGALALFISTSLVFTAFQWKQEHVEESILFPSMLEPEPLAYVPVTDIPPPPPPPVQQPTIIEVPNEEELLEEVEYTLQLDFDDPIPDLPPPEKEEPIEVAPVPDISSFSEMASFPGGLEAWSRYLRKNIRYPRTARQGNIQGKVFLSFDVSAKGEVQNIKVLRGIGGGCDKEAIRVLESSPKWKPALQRAQPVKSRMVIPISFKLR